MAPPDDVPEPRHPTEAAPGRTDRPAGPSQLARAVAFASIVVAGGAGGLIGFAFVDLQCEGGDCTVVASLAALLGGVVAATGVAVVAALALRATAEWDRARGR